MKLLDRYLLRSFLRAWSICFASLISLYIVVDAFQRLDEFISAAGSSQWRAVALVVARYYGVQLVQVFDRLGGTITTLAALFTLAWMQKSNEVVPLLAAGVPVRRVLRPILIGAALFIALAFANRELLLPRVASELQRPANDPAGSKLRAVGGLFDANGILCEGRSALPSERVVHDFACTLPARFAGAVLQVRAKEAYYIPPGAGPLTGGWLMVTTTPSELPPLQEPVLTMIDPGKLFLKTQRVDFDRLTRDRRWHELAPTGEIWDELDRADATNLSATAMELHLRLTTPLSTFLMTLMGLAILLTNQHRKTYFNLGLCFLLGAALFVATLMARYLGEKDFLDPALAAWLPIFVFGPLTLALLDSMQS
jgi:lipopolysaccharide export system permease protein